MRSIAIDDNRWLFYEGTHGAYGHAIWPSPSVNLATVLRPDASIEDALPKSDFINEARMVFREDSFDPVTRIRRGRLYKAYDTRPEDWQVQPHPAYATEDMVHSQRIDGRLSKRLYAFHAW